MAFDPDAYLAGHAAPTSPKSKGFDPDAYLAKSRPAAEPEAETPDVQVLGELPDESTLPPGHLDLKGRRGFVPDKRTRAVFTDITPSGEPGFTAEELRDIKPDMAEKSRTAFLGGTLQGATLGFGDEAAALFSDKPYAEARDENRRAFKDAQAMDPKSYAMGHMAGNAALLPLTPSLAPTAAKPLLSLANTGRAALGGAIQGLGESEADLTKGDLAAAAADTAKGAAIAAGVNAGLGALGKGYKAGAKYLAEAPERVAHKADDALIDSATLGAPASMRDELQGELGSDRPNLLAMIKGNPELRKAIEEKRYPDAVNMIRLMQNANKAAQAEEVARLDSGARAIAPAREAERVPGHRDPALNATQEMPAISMDDLVAGRGASTAAPKRAGSLEIDARPLVARMEARQKLLAANPSIESQAEAAAMQKRIDAVKERWIPSPPPKTPEGGELLKSLVGNAQKYDVDRAAHSADDFLDTAKRYHLPKTANDPTARLEVIDTNVAKLNKANDTIYEKAVKKQPIYIANFTGTLRDHADKLRLQYGSGSLPDAIDGFAAGIAKTAAARGETTISPRELRQIISDQQGKAFSGSFANPADAKEAWQEVTRVMRGHLEDHVQKYAGKAAFDELKRNNKDISILLPFRSSAEEEIAASRMLPSPEPETRTGFAKPSEIRDMISATKDADIKRELTGEFFNQIGTGPAHRLTALADEAARMSRLEAPLVHLAERGSTSPTTLRHHVGSIKGYLEQGGVGGGVALAAMGHVKEGAALITASLAAKYGAQAAKQAERGIASMVAASRSGATAKHLRTIAKMAKVPAQLAEDAIVMLAPREIASNRKGNQ